MNDRREKMKQSKFSIGEEVIAVRFIYCTNSHERERKEVSQ